MDASIGAISQLILLPKGGGALHGIGEKFSPGLCTGTGNFTVPIALLSGRNGFQPELNLFYSNGNGNGPFGLSWVLSVPGVTRKTSKGVPYYRCPFYVRPRLFQMMRGPNWDHISESPPIAIQNGSVGRPEVHLG